MYPWTIHAVDSPTQPNQTTYCPTNGVDVTHSITAESYADDATNLEEPPTPLELDHIGQHQPTLTGRQPSKGGDYPLPGRLQRSPEA